MSVVLDVVVREETGSGNARAARRDGNIPGVIYGGDEAAVSVSVKKNEVMKALNSGDFLGSMIELSHEGKKQKVFTKDVQFHPVSDFPVHVDFYRVTNKTLIEVEVTVNFIGEEESPGLKANGTLNVVRYSIEVKCPAGDIPESIDVDVSKLDIGDAVHISDVTLPKGAKPTITDRDFTIATIIASRVETEEDEDADEVDAADVPAIGQTDDEEA
jgi:large subunit ribosomal protein L25